MGSSSDHAMGPASASTSIPAAPASHKRFASSSSSSRQPERERGLSNTRDRSPASPVQRPDNDNDPNTPTNLPRASLDSPYRFAKKVWGARASPGMQRSKALPDDRDGELPPLQANRSVDENDGNMFKPVTDDDPTSYDLIAPVTVPSDESKQKETWNLEKQSQALFSKEHLQIIFSDPGYLLRFTSFLGLHRPQSVPILVHYLDSLKALRAIHYSNAILEGLDEVPGLDFTKGGVQETLNASLVKRATDAFDYLVREELPAFVTHEYIGIVSASISARISGMLAPHLREASEGLAEVFCLTDPSRPDNPIVFASEEFNRTTQYGMSYVLGRNCRFLQGPYTNPLAVRRLREAAQTGRQHQEVFLNYRRDGSPFMNLLMIAPLCDARGVVRYYIGAQVDVSGLVKDCVQMDSLARLMDKQSRGEKVPDHQKPNPEKNDELRELSEMLNMNELNTIHKFGGRMHKEDFDDEPNGVEDGSTASNQPRLLIKDPNTLTPPFDPNAPLEDDRNGYNSGAESRASSSASLNARLSGKLNGVYQHYLLIRPYPSLRILFASPSQRVPGILQSPFMNKIGGSNRVREELTAALADGRGVTAKVRWVSKQSEEGRNRWIHCTPLIGMNGQIGVWMIVIVDDERHKAQRERERLGGRMAPPVPTELPVNGRVSDRGRETPDRFDPNFKATPKAAKSPNNVRTPSASANAAHRYGYSAGDRPTMVDEKPRTEAVDTEGQSSARSFQI